MHIIRRKITQMIKMYVFNDAVFHARYYLLPDKIEVIKKNTYLLSDKTINYIFKNKHQKKLLQFLASSSLQYLYSKSVVNSL